MFYFFVFCFIGLVFADQTLNDWEQDSPAAQYLGLASGASNVVPNIRATFSCLGRRYGYFADVDNKCQIFHVCHPSIAANGEPVIYQFSKFCPKSTRFDQIQLTCLPETDPKLIPCSDSARHYPPTESRFADVRVVQQLESIQQLPEIEQRVEVVVEEPRRESLPVKGIQTDTRSVVANEGIPAKLLSRSEPLPQPIPQTVYIPVVEQRAEPIQQIVEPIVQQRAEPLIQQRVESIPIQQSIPVESVVSQSGVRNVELRRESLPINSTVESVVQRSYALRQEVVPIINSETLRLEPGKRYSAPALVLRNTQPFVESVATSPVQINRPVLTESDVVLRRTVPQTQYIRQTQSLVQPSYVPQQYIRQYVSVSQSSPRVVRPTQYSGVVNRNNVVAEQQPIVYIPVQSNYGTIPQYLRTNVEPNVVRSAQIPTSTRLSNKAL